MAQATTSLRSVGWLTLLTLGQMGLQFAFQMWLAKHFGAESAMDAFVAALTLPMVISGVLAGALASAFVPIYVETRQLRGETVAWSMAVQVLCWLFLSTMLLWQAARHFATPLMQMLYPGFDDFTVWDAAELFQALSSLLLWNSLGSLARVWNHCRGRFAITGFAAVLGNGVTLFWAWSRADGNGAMTEVAHAVSLGSLVAFAVQMPWFRLFSHGWPSSYDSQAAVKRCFVSLWPLAMGLACTQLDDLCNRYLASQLPGGVSHLGYASRLTTAVLTLLTSGLAVVAFPSFATHAAERAREKLSIEIAAALRFLIVLLIPVVVALVGFGQPLIHDLLERGQFTAADTQVVASLLMLLCGQIVGGSLGEIAAKVFYADGDSRTPMVVLMCGFVLGVFAKIWCFQGWGIRGLASATAAFFLFNAVCLLVLLARRHGRLAFQGLASACGRAALGSAAAALTGMLLLRTSWPLCALWGAAAGGVVFVIVMALLRDEFLVRAQRMIWHSSRSDGSPS